MINVSEQVPLRVLLVEDNRAEAALVARLLVMAAAPRFDVITVHQLADALTVLEERRVDLVLLDLGLPDVSSELEGLQLLRQTFSTTPVVVLTGVEHSDDLRASVLDLGAVECLFKQDLNPEAMHQTLYGAVRRDRHSLVDRFRRAVPGALG